MSMDDLQQFKDTYITECFELLEEMESKLMELSAESANSEDLNAIFRCAHSIKGGAGAFGFDNIAAFTHILEALLDQMREETIAVSPEAVDTLLKARDVVFQMVGAAQEGRPLAADFGSEVAAALAAFNPDMPQPTAKAAAPAAKTEAPELISHYNIVFAPHRDLISNGNEPLLLLRELAGLGEARVTCDTGNLPAFEQTQNDGCYLKWEIDLVSNKPESAIKEVFEFVEDECDLSISVAAAYDAVTGAPVETKTAAPKAPAAKASSEKPAAKPDAESANAAKAAPSTGSIRVDIDKVDALINMVGEVVITQAFLSAQVSGLPQENAALIRGVDEMVQHIRELQEAVMAIRMQPVKSIFSRMPRLVRDLSAQLQKDIVMEMHGEQTEVDKTIIEQLSDPLTHMIRNSVDHGIESPEKREAAGKPRQGTIELSAEHRGGRIVIQIKDDGGGINREKVRAKAIEKGIIAEGANLSDNEIDMLIFAPGFSTADQVTSVSGRGVGMDVVRRNIEGLGGTVLVENRPGEGSTFGISLPLTLAILDGMIVRCGREFYIIPIGHIIETMRPKSGDVKSVASGQSVVNVRGEFLPIIFLNEMMNIKGAQTDPSKALVVLVENGKQQMGLVVDELVGQQQVVIKSLEENSDPIEGISGATILGDGKVSLILDIAALHRISMQDRARMEQVNNFACESSNSVAA